MKKKKSTLKMVACILVLSLSITMLQPLAVFAEQDVSSTQTTLEKWAPSERDIRLPNTTGDLTLEQLETAKLSSEDIPEYISQQDIEEKGHVNRLREQEPNDNTIVFQNRDGTKTAYFFSNPVKYTDKNGNTKDKYTKLDSTSIPERYSEKYGYVNQQNDIKTYFPKQMETNQGMLLESEDISVELIPIEATEKKYVLQNGSIVTPGEYISKHSTVNTKTLNNISTSNGITKIQTEKLTAQKANANKEHITDELTSIAKDTVQYNGVFGSKTTLRYSSTFEGLKEDIVLSENTGVNNFSFRLKTNGLSLVCREDKQYYLADPLSGEYLVAIGELIVYDSNNRIYKNDEGEEYNHHYEVTTVKADEEYILTVGVDEEFLNSSDTVYPVYIDPTMTVMPKGSVQDAAIYSSGYAFSNDEKIVKIGRSESYGIGRGLYNFPILNFNTDFIFMYGNQISSAKLNLYALPYGNSSSYDSSKTLSMYEFYSPWSQSTVKWNNTNPNNYGTYISSANVTSGWTSFDISYIVDKFKTDSDYTTDFKGVIIKADSESASTWKKFVSSLNTTYSSTYRPYIEITYNDSPAACSQIESGATYYLRNYNSEYLDVDNANTTDNTRLLTGAFNGNTNQQFKITNVYGGEYEIAPQHTTGKVLSVNSLGQVVIEEDCNLDRQRWYIYYRNGSYHIVNKSSRNGVMAPTYDTDYVSINNEYEHCCWELERITDPFHPCNIEYVTYTKLPDPDGDYLACVFKSTLSADEFFSVSDGTEYNTGNFIISNSLISELNSLESAYQEKGIFTPVTLEEECAHIAKGSTDALVSNGYITNYSSEYYGIWAFHFEERLEFEYWFRGIFNTALAAYSVYLTATSFYYSYLSSTSLRSTYVSSSQYNNLTSYIDDIDDAMNGMSFTNRKVISAEERNLSLQGQGYTNPYEAGTPVVKFSQSSTTQYVRVYTNGTTQPAGKWIMKYSDIQGLTPAQIQSKFALPNTPTHYCFVSVPKGTEMYAGIVGENYGYTAGQAVQFELGTNIPTESFGAGIPLP